MSRFQPARSSALGLLSSTAQFVVFFAVSTTSKYNQACGFDQTTFVKVPVRLNGFAASNSAANE